MLPEVHEVAVLARGVQIVDQQAHAHAAIRGAADVLEQVARRLVLPNDVVLDVERALGVIGERDQAVEGLIARGQQADAGEVASLAFLARGDDAAERGVLRIVEGYARMAS